MMPPVLGDEGRRIVVPLSEAIALAEKMYGRLSRGWSFLPPETPEEKKQRMNNYNRKYREMKRDG